ncbi:hypothetical protein NLX83_27625 [Allokutzneria sp. A3M-2-11 16]|uniref:hypothetical protein n=1 Tax=Allokutzneria sp. A3M-2-11 16 TaxID=2962043 RepID=UPI0020B81F39|nr:hypothetical protein [Allokutzneria sp. A3M-2-11 16]MCP3803051.1 hypothetical protein [Allokutzneria sp. A3M-2-11 16]
MRARKLAAAFLVAGSVAAMTGGVAAASAAPEGHWKVFATYPATPQGWRDCGNAVVNVAKGDCKLNSDTGATVDLWGWES